MKKVAVYLLSGFVALLLLLFLIPVIFKDKIVSLVKDEINQNIAAKVDFSAVQVSMFRHFPKLSVGLENLSVTGIDAFQQDTLLSAASVDATVNLISVIRGGAIKVHGVYLQSPRIRALVNKEGKANWDITQSSDTTAATGEPSSFVIKLEKYAVNNGYVYYRDEMGNMSAEIIGLDHEGSGDFTQDAFSLTTRTRTTGASFTYAGIPYLLNAQTGVDATFDIHTTTSKYAFRKAALTVNDLQLQADGFIQLLNDSTYNLDVDFEAPSNDFKNILSLVPAVYKSDFNKLKTSGTAAFKGFVKGTYSPQQLPAYQVDLQVKDGFFQYPDLPQPVKNIQITAQVSNTDGVMDHTVVNVSKGHIEMGQEPFDFQLLFKNPETTQYLDAVVKGKLDLANVSQFIKLEAGTQLSGLVWADVFAKGTLAALEQQKGPFSAGGFLEVRNLHYASKDFPQPIQNGQFKIVFENRGGIADATTVDIASGHVEIGRDPLDFSLKISRPVSAVDFACTAKGRFTLDHVKQFVALEPGTSLKGLLEADVSFSGSKAAIDQKDYSRINTTGKVNLSNVHYTSSDYPEGLQLQKAQWTFSPQSVALQGAEGRFLKTQFSANGLLNNLIGYALHKDELQGRLDVTAEKINLNEWMGTDTAAAAPTAMPAPFLVPERLHLTVNAQAQSVQYDKVDYTQVKGSLLVKDETIHLQNVQTNALDGSVALDGSYSTRQHKQQPDIKLSYNIKEVDVQKAFYAYNTVQKLMPIGQFLSGKLSSQFNMTGKLKGDMFPDLSSLTGQGNFLLLQGVLRQFKPMDQLASSLNVSALKDISLKDIKSYFEFANGMVLVKPFTVKIKDIDLQIGGMHGIDQQLNYLVGMQLPRSYIGDGGNALVNKWSAQATAKGLPLTVPDVIDLNVKIEGSLTRPVIKTDLKEASGNMAKELQQQATDFMQQKAADARQTVKDSLTTVKQQVIADVKSEVTKQLFTKDSADQKPRLQETKEKATQTLKNTLGNLLKKKNAAGDSTTTSND